MLYDNAQLAVAYLEAFRLAKRPLYRQIAKETLDYVLLDMTDEAGGFHSTRDADSEGEEGKYYVWSMDEIRGVLGDDDSDLFCRYYGVKRGGNFEGHSILHVPVPPAEFVLAKMRRGGRLLHTYRGGRSDFGLRLIARPKGSR